MAPAFVKDQESVQCPFLIVGYGDELHGDSSAGLRVAMTVEGWQLSDVKALAVPRLMPKLVSDVANADYVIFVSGCSCQSRAQTFQLDPIEGHSDILSSLSDNGHGFDPVTLLSLTQRLYDCVPQAWLMQVPTERSKFGRRLSSTAQRGCDRALRTIETFLQTYQCSPKSASSQSASSQSKTAEAASTPELCAQSRSFSASRS
ncbi:MAG: hydrogenase maturation protease [Phormidesmis sp.]